ncbi:hypothetical protein [Treponema sp.]|uniref:hypothetical protein n=1 Tax=Treponema sp. TaxID=166 RepID=UPI00389028DA
MEKIKFHEICSRREPRQACSGSPFHWEKAEGFAFRVLVGQKSQFATNLCSAYFMKAVLLF